VQAEQALAFYEEAHFVFAVGVFSQKLLAQSFAIGVVRRHPDRIHGGIAGAGLHPLDLCGVGLQHGVRASAGG
jgi:hypothetical protein